MTRMPTDRALQGPRRRSLLLGGAAAAGLLTALPSRAGARVMRDTTKADPFTLGIASGDPLPTSVVIWTRLAPSPYEVGGGVGGGAHPVQWEVALDPQMRKVVRRGTAMAHPELAHSVHVDVQGLEPRREYWYRFRSGRHLSPVGRTLTAPARGQRTDDLHLVVASCQNIGAGWYHAWHDAATDPADLVLFTGDYIYEYQVTPTQVRSPYYPQLPDDYARRPDTLDRFRQQYSLYKTDPHLQEARHRR